MSQIEIGSVNLFLNPNIRLMLKYAVGIDVSMEDLYVCFMCCREDFSSKILGTRKFSNNHSGIKNLLKWISSKRKDQSIPLQIGMEATGVYHEDLAYTLSDSGYELSVLVPGKVKAYFLSIGLVSKNDPSDAKGLAQMMIERKWDVWSAPTKQIRDLRSLYRYRDSLQGQLTQVRNKLHAITHGYSPNRYIIKELNKQIKSLDRQVEKVDAEIEKQLNQNTVFSQKAKQIADSIKGLGIQTVGQIASELDGFNLITSQSQLTSYAGYDVLENQSGNHIGKTRISKRGNKYIRKALHFPAFNVVRFEGDVFEQLFTRVYDRTKIKMKGYVAVQRKLLCLIYALWKNDTAFVKNYQQQITQKVELTCEMTA